MSLNPLNELKRRLEDDATPLPKRLCLAKNLVHSHHFPTAPKERIVAEWLDSLSKTNKLDNKELQKLLDWLNYDDLTGELKAKLIQIVSHYVQKNILQTSDFQFIVKFLENDKISSQMGQQIDDYLSITVTLLQCLKGSENANLNLSQKIFNNFVKYYKESKRKLEFITKFIEGECLETVFSYLDTEIHDTIVEVCQNIIFHANKKSFFINYLQTLIRKDSLEALIAEKGDNIQAVLKIMGVFFDFPKHRVDTDTKFLQNFIEVFVSSYKTEGLMIFTFYIMVARVLEMKQDYITSQMTMPLIETSDKIKRSIFLSMLEIALKYDVDISIKLADSHQTKKPSKAELKKTFILFLQAVMLGQLKLEGKLDKTTLLIIKTALKLDPVLIEQNLEFILPPIMTAKKNSSVIEQYKELLNCLMEILFKLSRGNVFITELLPYLKISLMAIDKEQTELINLSNGDEKAKSKVISGVDVFPDECVELYGKLTTDLMFRQNKELLETLQKDFLMHCSSSLEEETLTPSTTTLVEITSAILSSFLRHNKMADHTVPLNIAEEFWGMYTKFENEGLKRFGAAVMKFSGNTQLLKSFFTLCQSYAQLKLLNIKYSNYKLDVLSTSQVFDLSGLLPCLESGQWIELGGKVTDEDCLVVLDNLLLLKTMAMEVLAIRNSSENSNTTLQETKTHLIKRLASNPAILESNTFIPRVLFANLDKSQYKQLAKSLVKLYFNDEVAEIFKNVAITNNRSLLNALVLEVAKNAAKCFQNCDDLVKALGKEGVIAFAKGVDMKKYFNELVIEENSDEKIKKCIELIKTLQISYLEENYQLTALFVLLAVKKTCQSKKIRKSIDYAIQNIFELSLHPPDLYKVFPVDFLFCFKDTTMLDLLTLNIKTSNQLLVIKNLIESAVKRVRVESDLVKNIVDLLLSKKSTKHKTIEAFNEPKFQIICIILPLLVKQRKAITASAYRSILAELQEKLHKPLLETFKNIDFSTNKISGNSNLEESSGESNINDVATLNAMAAYSLTLSKNCESTEAEDLKSLDCLWDGLGFFVDNAIQAMEKPESKPQHIESSIQLLNVTLRHIKKLESHNIFNNKDQLFTKIWLSSQSRLTKVLENEGSLMKCGFLEELGVLVKFVCELVSVECFGNKFVGDLASLVVLKPPSTITKDSSKSDLTSHSVSKYLWIQCLKANTAGPKCTAMSKLMYQSTNNLKGWIRQHYDSVASKRKLEVYDKVVKVDYKVCELIRVHLDTLAEVILAGKRVTLDYKFLDSIFELQHMVHLIIGFNTSHIRCDISWPAFFTLFEGSVGILNNLLVSREEILEDRWPCYMQCYRALISLLCSKATSQTPPERHIEEKLAEIAHSIEKLTQSITKRKKHVSRIASYTIADICTALEQNAPSRIVRQHLESCVSMLIQASESTHAVAFLRRALAGCVGQLTVTNLYTMYKRYHKYTGNS